MDIKQVLTNGAHMAWSRKSAATGLKGMAALAVGRWLWGKWQNRSPEHAENGDRTREDRIEPRAM